MASLLVGIAGGSGSGKTTLAKGVAAALPPGQAVVIPHDAYYRDLGYLPFAERSLSNFDEPAALDNDRLLEHLTALRAGNAIAKPNYDFVTHTRLAATTPVSPASVVIVEGILVLAIPALRGVLDFKVYVDCSESIRLARRVWRDCVERGRTKESVVAQYQSATLPMHALHVAPSRAWADLVVSGEAEPGRAIESCLVGIHRKLRH